MELIRQAGFNERRCIARDSLSLYGYIVTLATYHTAQPEKLPIPKDVLCAVLESCIVQHPVLGAVVQDSATEKPWLARSSVLDLDPHVQILDTFVDNQDAFQAMLEIAHNTTMTDYEKRPQWKVYIGCESPSRFHMAFACSHALADGRSGLFFHQKFLETLNESKNLQPANSPVVSLTANAKILPPLELAGSLPISWTYLLGPLLNEYVPVWLVRAIGLQPKDIESSNSDPIWTGASKRPEKPATELPTTSVQTSRIPYDMVQKTLAVCKSHHARLTGLLLHLAIRSLARALNSQGKDYRRFKVSTALDLRKLIPGSKDKMGVLVSSIDETVLLEPAHIASPTPLSDQDWDAIRSTTQRLETASSTLSDQPVGLLKYLSNYRDWTSRKSQSAAETSFEVSNLGRFEGSKTASSNWTIERMTFSQSADATGSPFSLNAASVDNGPLTIVLSWWPGMLGAEDERRLAKDICDGIVAEIHALSN